MVGLVWKTASCIPPRYTTFAFLGGIDDVTDQAAAEAGLPPVDGKNLWPYLAGEVDTSPRTDVLLGTGSTEINGIVAEETYVSASGRSVKLWKRLEGGISQAGWTGPECPNATYRTPRAGHCNPFCLFDLSTDPTEVSLRQQDNTVANTCLTHARTLTTLGSEAKVNLAPVACGPCQLERSCRH